MSDSENFHINYWGTDVVEPQNSNNKRSIRKKLLIVLSFLFILAIIPALAWALSSYNQNQAKKVSIAKAPTSQTTQTSPTTSTPLISPTPAPQVQVLNNDSYWKISKRYCGSGKYYLSIRDQNDAKSLHKGDLVTVSCSF